MWCARVMAQTSARGRDGDARPHVALVSRIFAPEPGAAPQRLLALVRGLADQGADVTVLTSSTRARARVEEHRAESRDVGTPWPHQGTEQVNPRQGQAHPARRGRIRVRRWPVLRDATGAVRGYLPYLSFDLPAALRLLVTRRVDVVVVEQPPTTALAVALVSAVRRAPYVYYAGDVLSSAVEASRAPAPVVRVVRWMESVAMRRAATVLTVSRGVTERVRALGARHVAEVGFGVDTDVFFPDGDVPRDKNLLVYAGTASEIHGAEVFLEALPRVREVLPDARMLFVGQGTSWPRLRELAETLPEGAAQVREPVGPTELASILRSAGAALASISPGQGYDFAVATKALSALATGTPVVYVGVGPTAEVVRQLSAGRVASHDVDTVAGAIVTALTADEVDPEVVATRAAGRWSGRAVGSRAATVVLSCVR